MVVEKARAPTSSLGTDLVLAGKARPVRRVAESLMAQFWMGERDAKDGRGKKLL